MTVHSLSPGWLQLNYTSNSHAHRMIIPVQYVDESPDPGTPPMLFQKDGGQVALATAIGLFVDAIDPLFHTSTTFDRVEAFAQDTPTSDPYWVSGYTITAQAGTDTVANTPYGMVVMSFRSDEGGIYKMYLMEGSIVPNQRVNAPTYGGVSELVAVLNYVMGAGSIVRARDGGSIISGVRMTSKYSDALRRKYLLT
jgi:hypothetical protein